MTTSSKPLLSVVIPVFNEEGNLRLLHQTLCQQLTHIDADWELIYVNDGSRDRSIEVLRSFATGDSRVKVVGLSRNFGHQNALTAGLEHASGDAVISLDADMQHPPSLLPEMVDRWREGYQVVYTLRQDTTDVGILKRFTSDAFYWVINRLTDTPIIPGAADFRLVDRQVLNSLNSMQESSRFIRGLVSWVGFKQIGIPYVVQPRHDGKSKYTLRKMVSLALNGITSFSTVPLRLSTYFGFAAAMVGVPYAIWAIYARIFTNSTSPGWASLITVILFLGGVQLICLGIIGEYLGRIYDEVKNRPLYLTQELIGFDANDDEASGDANRITIPFDRPKGFQRRPRVA